MQRAMIGALGMILLTVAAGCNPPPATPTPPTPRTAEGYEISGPYTHGNLSIFLLHGPDKLKGKMYLTIQEAMDQKKLVVHETGTVNELAVENVSDEEVYIQSGDIVKGGRQDRTFAFDFIVPPKSGKMPIASFCVESGRWRQRGQEEAAAFAGGSNYALSSKSLKVAAKEEADQGKVWSEVQSLQHKVSENVAADVRANDSQSSLQLSLENKKLQETTDEYIKSLAPIAERRGDVIGYAFAINGEVNSADVYASNAFFKKLWPKLLRASAVEAVAELRKDQAFKPATVDAVRMSMASAEKGKAAATRPVNARTDVATFKAEDSVLYETRDKAQPSQWIHRNYMTREPSGPAPQPAPPPAPAPQPRQSNAPAPNGKAPQPRQQGK